MATHLTVLAVLYALTSAGELFGALVLFGLAGAGAFIPEPFSALLVAGISTAVGVFLLILALPGLLLAYALVARKSWAVPLAWVLGILNLFNFPIGTVLGVYTIWAITQDQTRLLLGRTR